MSAKIRIATLLVVVAAVRLSAATHVWTGASSNLFSDLRNWSGGSPAGDREAELVFPEALRQSVTNDIAGLTVRSITFTTDGYVIRGNAITLLEGAEIETRENEIACELRFDGTVVEAPAGAYARFSREARPELGAEAAPRTDAQSEVFTFGPDFVSARVTPFAETAWLALVPWASGFRTYVQATRVSDTDGDGTARWQDPLHVVSRSPSARWCVVDQSARRVYAATGDGAHIEPAPPLKARFLVDGNGNYSTIDVTWSGHDWAAATLWVRPGVGAWRGGPGAFEILPKHAPNRRLVSLPQMVPIAGSPSAPAGAERGDIFVGVSVGLYGPGELFGGLVDDALAAAPESAAEVGMTFFPLLEQDATARFRITRYGSTERAITVSYRVSAETAVAGVHFEEVAGTVTLVRGERSRDIYFPLIDDDTYSASPRVRIQLRDLKDATIVGGRSAELMIRDDDPTPVVSASDGSVQEGGEGEQQVPVELTLTGKTRSRVDVQVRAYVNGGNSPSQVTKVVFEPGETRKTISIPYSGNNVAEGDRSIRVEVVSGNYANAGREGLIYIVDDDSIGLTAHDVTVSESARKATVRVTLSAPVAERVTVNYDTVGLGHADGDVVRVTGQLTFEPGQTEKRVAVPIVQDQFAEDDEIVMFTLSGASANVMIRRPARITITDDADLPSITLEGDRVVQEGAVYAVFHFTTRPRVQKKLRLGVRLLAGTATAGADYRSEVLTPYGTRGYVEVDPSMEGDYLVVEVYSDAIVELTETFTVEMFEYGNPSNVLASAMLRIKDRSHPSPTLRVNGATVREGQTASFTVTLSHPSQQTVSFRARTISDGAEAGSDFQAVSSIYTLTPGTLSLTVDVPTFGDGELESDERFAVELSEAFNATIHDGVGRALILDDDHPNFPAVLVENVSTPQSVVAHESSSVGRVQR
ncbi:MAG TPA: Calx-beta domain-containing protein [Thermoanaerobaculia bacterium]|nr:Calx-beta domain-containing protein [Thermoanaerobaculia bacterium]